MDETVAPDRTGEPADGSPYEAGNDPRVLELFRLAVLCAREREQESTTWPKQDWRISTLVLSADSPIYRLRFAVQDDGVLLHFENEPFLFGKVTSAGEVTEVSVVDTPALFQYPAAALEILTALQAAIAGVRGSIHNRARQAAGHA